LELSVVGSTYAECIRGTNDVTGKKLQCKRLESERSKFMDPLTFKKYSHCKNSLIGKFSISILLRIKRSEHYTSYLGVICNNGTPDKKWIATLIF
jgi:hypothetical protein